MSSVLLVTFLDTTSKLFTPIVLKGIRIAKEKGVKFGRPKVILPPNTGEILDDFINHKITNIEGANLLNVSRGKFFRLANVRRNAK